MELVEFLRARLDEDEQEARHAATGYAGRAVWQDVDGSIGDGTGEVVIYKSSVSGLVIPHIARHDPARVLREVEAKRVVIDEHKPEKSGALGYLDGTLLIDWSCCSCATGDYDSDGAQEHDDWPCATMRALAAVYQDHPDFNPQWRMSEVGE